MGKVYYKRKGWFSKDILYEGYELNVSLLNGNVLFICQANTFGKYLVHWEVSGIWKVFQPQTWFLSTDLIVRKALKKAVKKLKEEELYNNHSKKERKVLKALDRWTSNR